jgi:hypothetical protein
MPKPGFFIVGAPKSGTTAMFDYLGQHPEIYTTGVKEVPFFGSDLEYHRRPDTTAYLKFFDKGKQQLCGDAMVWYLYSQKAAQEIHSFNPTAKIIIMLRKPVDLIYSLHSQLLYNGNIYNGDENITDFEEALKAEEERKKKRMIPENCSASHKLLYSEIVQFTSQVQRYFDVFSRDAVKIIIYDDFKQDTIGVYHDTLKFLGVKPGFQPEIKVVNPNKKVRSTLFHSFFMSPYVHSFVRPFFPKWMLRKNVFRFIKQLNTVYQERPPMCPSLRKRLVEQFAPEVDRLSLLLEQDLSHWKTV